MTYNKYMTMAVSDEYLKRIESLSKELDLPRPVIAELALAEWVRSISSGIAVTSTNS